MADQPFAPSTYSPFLRRFGSERERELREVADLYQRIKPYQDRLLATLREIWPPLLERSLHMPEPLAEGIGAALARLLSVEPYLQTQLAPPDFGRMSLEEFVNYRNVLLQKEYFFRNQAGILKLVQEALRETVLRTVDELPAVQTPTPFTIPLAYALPHPKETMEQLYNVLRDPKFFDRGVLRTTTQQLTLNIIDGASGGKADKVVRAGSSPLPLDKAIQTYLGGTAFQALFETPVPLKLSREDRFNHMLVCGGPGAGKSTLLRNLILHDLASDDPPSIVVIDPHSDLVQSILELDVARVRDRVIYINPKDTPALNLFAVDRARHASYDEHMREQVRASIIQTFNLLFTALAGSTGALTSKQQILFTYCTELLLTFPEVRGRNATIIDLLDLLIDGDPFIDVIQALDPLPRRFFEQDFLPKRGQFQSTKDEVGYRLRGILANPAMARLLSSEETKVDLWSALNGGALVLVDTAKDYLKDGSAVFGRLMISLVLQNLMERAALPEGRRKDTFLIVDEASDFFSDQVDDLLTEVRKFRCGCVFAFQYLSQASGELRASLLGATGSKFVSQVSANDARVFASEMRTTSEFIADQPRLQFAAHIRNVTPQAVAIPIKPITDLPRLSTPELDRFLAWNRARVTATRRPALEPPRANAAAEPPRASRPAATAPTERPEDTNEW